MRSPRLADFSFSLLSSFSLLLFRLFFPSKYHSYQMCASYSQILPYCRSLSHPYSLRLLDVPAVLAFSLLLHQYLFPSIPPSFSPVFQTSRRRYHHPHVHHLPLLLPAFVVRKPSQQYRPIHPHLLPCFLPRYDCPSLCRVHILSH